MQFTASRSIGVLVLLGIHAISAQLTIDCDPLTKTCPPNPALGGTYFYDFTKGAQADWQAASGTHEVYDSNGLNFYLTSYGQTLALTKYIFFGNVQAWVKTVNGSGIIASVILEADTKDEIDWEWLGSDNAHTQTNYFWHAVQGKDPGNKIATQTPQDTWHNYTIDWTPELLVWYIDGQPVRQLTYAYADSGADPHPSYPQTPARVSMGGWIGCATKECYDSGQATIQHPNDKPTCEQAWTCRWAEGYLQPATGPFHMTIANVTVRDYGCGTGDYTYSDMTGAMAAVKGRQQCQASQLATQTPKAVARSSSTSSSKASGSSSTSTKPGQSTTSTSTQGQSGSTTTSSASGGAGSVSTTSGSISGSSSTSITTGGMGTNITSAAPGSVTPATVICSQTGPVVVTGPDGRITIGIPPETITDANGATMVTTAPIRITAGPNGQVTVSGYIPSMTGQDGTVTVFNPTQKGTKTIATSGPVAVPGQMANTTTTTNAGVAGSTSPGANGANGGTTAPGAPGSQSTSSMGLQTPAQSTFGVGSAASSTSQPWCYGWSVFTWSLVVAAVLGCMGSIYL